MIKVAPQIAVVCAEGIGDGLIMHIASHNLAKQGFHVTTFSNHLPNFGKWLQGHRFSPQPKISEIPDLFSSFNAVILQHDNSLKAKQIEKLNLKIFRFYGSHKEEKHGALTENDYVCDLQKSMVTNLSSALHQWFGIASIENGLTPPPGLVHRKYAKRIAIHTSSGLPTKNWPLNKFTQVSSWLEKKGLEPFFLFENGIPIFPSLEELASFLYESGAFLGNDSGPGHLASCLNIPSLIIGQSLDHLQLWSPGWYPSRIVTPSKLVSHFKWTRKKWKFFVHKGKVIRNLKKLIVNL